ncbi:MAG: hypothetical protein IH963_03060, partial [Chloroflexi bacterium]|nr:hypothetical protein [Chloroflexota bacterium]
MLDYRAKILTPWIDLSEQHSNFRKKAEQVIEAFSRGKSVPHIAVTGPYGQGKTQFLFHLMRIALDNNCIPVYTYASSLRDLVTETTNAAKFADIVHTAAFAEVDAIRKNKPGPLTTDTALSDFIRDRSPTGLPKAPVILFVDEWEQVYAELQNVVTTSDRNPLRALFDRSDIHLVLGFAPLSSYESGAGNLLGQGEADRRRLTVFRIPPVSPRQFRDYLQLDPGQANFFWWLGRGRMGLVLKAYQDSKNFDIQSSDGISSLVNVSMGNISGVPALDLDTLFEKSNWREIYDLHPRDAASATRCVFILDEGFEEKSKAFFMKLGFTAANSLSLGHYLQMLLEALSNKDGIAVLNSAEDFTVLVEATRDLALEFVDSPEAAHAFQERYEGLGSQADLTMRGLLDTTGTVGAPGVVLIHMIPPSNDRSNYPSEFITRLVDRGINVLNIDRRGANGPDSLAMTAYTGPDGKFDVIAAVGFLLKHQCAIPSDKIAIVGASNGTTTAMDYAIFAGAEQSVELPKALVFLTGGQY